MLMRHGGFFEFLARVFLVSCVDQVMVFLNVLHSRIGRCAL